MTLGDAAAWVGIGLAILGIVFEVGRQRGKSQHVEMEVQKMREDVEGFFRRVEDLKDRRRRP